MSVFGSDIWRGSSRRAQIVVSGCALLYRPTECNFVLAAEEVKGLLRRCNGRLRVQSHFVAGWQVRALTWTLLWACWRLPGAVGNGAEVAGLLLEDLGRRSWSGVGQVRLDQLYEIGETRAYHVGGYLAIELVGTDQDTYEKWEASV